jgi:hypothetical protein
MMMVMTMMEVELHLSDNPKQGGLICQIRECEFFSSECWPFAGGAVQNCEMRFRRANFVSILGLAACVASISFGAVSVKPAEPVDLNRATVAELMRVPGMTASWANRIVRFRPYRTKRDLLEEGVVTPQVYQRIHDGVVAHRADKGR